MTKAWFQGWEAAENGGSNPYKSDDDRSLEWFDGWAERRRQDKPVKVKSKALWTREGRFS